MSSFSGLLEKGIVFACCLTLWICQKDLPVSVVPMLAAVICNGLLSFLEDVRLKNALFVLYIILSSFYPPCAFFLPLFACDIELKKAPMLLLLFIPPIILLFGIVSLYTGIAVICLMPITVLLRKQSLALAESKSRYFELSDTTKEYAQKLKQQNHELMVQQDNNLTLATLNERNRIAREIHDNVGHLLSRALLQAGALAATNHDASVKEPLETLGDTLTQAMDSIRSSVHNLYDESIDLHAQLTALIQPFKFCEMRLDDQLTTELSRKQKTAVIAICKEALSNIMKHSNATQGEIILREHPGFYQFIFRDNGVVRSFQTEDGLGLANMRERIEALKGQMHVTTEKGFAIFISMPKGDE